MKKILKILFIICLTFTKEVFCMFNSENKKFVGVGCIFIQDEKVLTVLRTKTGRNDNLYGLIGGLVEPHEPVKQAAIREIYEEVGVKVNPEDLELIHVMSSIENDVEVIGCYFLVKKWEGEPFNKASDKHERIEWISLYNLPQNMIARNKQAVEHMLKKFTYSEYGWNK
jgi:ADP-ribose pyrophosphatase YjhB (NUDIX family)